MARPGSEWWKFWNSCYLRDGKTLLEHLALFKAGSDLWPDLVSIVPAASGFGAAPSSSTTGGYASCLGFSALVHDRSGPFSFPQ